MVGIEDDRLTPEEKEKLAQKVFLFNFQLNNYCILPIDSNS